MARFRPTRPAVPRPDPSEEDDAPERVFHDAAARFLDEQFRINEALDTKAAASFSVGSTVLPVTFGLLTLAPDRLPENASWVLRGALLAYAVLLACAFRASTYRGLENRPNLDTLDDYSTRYRGKVLVQWVAREYVTSAELNERHLERKARWTGWAGLALYAEGLLLSIAALLTLL